MEKSENPEKDSFTQETHYTEGTVCIQSETWGQPLLLTPWHQAQCWTCLQLPVPEHLGSSGQAQEHVQDPDPPARRGSSPTPVGSMDLPSTLGELLERGSLSTCLSR